MTRPELLAPAGSFSALIAAVQCGADAVYLGLDAFNARRGAQNFSRQTLADAVRYCHLRGVKVYLTLNTLLFDRELERAVSDACFADSAGVDAVLVQDLGLLQAVRRAAPELTLHASTQLTVHSADGARAALDMGISRVVLAREMDRDAIAAVCALGAPEVEVFIHGAQCMSYSGQCTMSALIGGRSGNRGRCAQPCRLPYARCGEKSAHPLSLKDRNLAAHLAELSEMGVACLKIEGRMKRPEYVAVVTAVYAALLRERRLPTPEEETALLRAFSRDGFSDGYFTGHTGAELFGTRSEDERDPEDLFSTARAFYERGEHRTVPVDFAFTMRRDTPVSLTVSDGSGHRACAEGDIPEPARNRSTTAEELSRRLAKTGGTVFVPSNIDIDIDDGLSISAAAVNALRRSALSDIETLRTEPPRHRQAPYLPPQCGMGGAPDAPRFTVSVEDISQLSKELISLSPARIYVPLHQIDRLSAFDGAASLFCAVLPRVFFDAQRDQITALLDRAAKCGVTMAAPSNIGHLRLLRDYNFLLCGDYGLNVTNSAALQTLAQYGLSSAAVSFELRHEQIRDLVRFLPTEAIVYGRLPLMLTETCPIGRDKRECRRCGARDQILQDRKGAAFPVLPVFGCRGEVQNSKVLYLADKNEYRQIGLSFARLRFTTESAEQCVDIFCDYLNNDCPHTKPESFTRGLFYRSVE